MICKLKVSPNLIFKNCLLIVFVSTAEEIRKPIIPDNTSEKRIVCNVTIQEDWKQSEWLNSVKNTVSYDLKSSCLKEEIQKWDGTKWINYMCKVSYYDKLQFEKEKVFYLWNKNGNWDMIEGERPYVDTIINDGTRMILYNCIWEPKQKIWIAEDSIFYDQKGRISRQVSRDSVFSEELKKNTGIVITSECIYLNENTWIEIQTTNYTEEKNVEKEQFRYRKANNSEIPTYSIDAWDEGVNRWILNTATLFRKQSGIQTVYDSIEEVIKGQQIPVFINEEQRDNSGNLMLRRIKTMEYNEDKNEWNGTYYKWERVRYMAGKEYCVAESCFTLDSYGKKWQLNSYEKKLCRLALNGKFEESGYYDKNVRDWEFVQSFDTLLPNGIHLNKEKFFDSKKKQWVPLTDYTYTESDDTVFITKTGLNIYKNKWENDSLITIQLDSSGAIVSKINHVWTKDGLFTGKWERASRICYVRL